MENKNIHLGESFLDRLIKDTYNKNSLGDLSTEQMNELNAYIKSDDFKTKSQKFKSTDRTKFEGSMDHFFGKDTEKSRFYQNSLANPDKTKYLIPRLARQEQPQTPPAVQAPPGHQAPPTAQTPPERPSTPVVQTPPAVQGQHVGDSNETIAEQVASKKLKQKEVASAMTQRFLHHNNFRKHYNGTEHITIDGKQYPLMVTTGLYGSNYGIENDHSYAFDPETGKIRKVNEDMFGRVELKEPGYEQGPKWAEDSEWVDINVLPGFKKQGGTMNRINYFQQGGQAKQQDLQQQVVALVQAAMQGDEKANQTVNQIMEAAKQGDQQAVQLAQMIQAVVQQMKGQTVSAKWGSKLAYIRSLKYAKGGKSCAPCKKRSTKKVEEKACGGKSPIKVQEKACGGKTSIKVEEKACGGKAKKAKKRYFGGWL